MKGNKLIVGALVAAFATVTGCTLTIDFDPRGVDVSLEGDWLVNGAPANPSNCAAAGIDSVQLVFYDGGVAYEFSDFRFDCGEGFFDTRPRRVLDHGRYQTQWVAYDASSVELGRGPMILLDVGDFSVDHAILATADFVITGTPGFNPLGDVGSLGATWSINGNPADAALCASGGIQTMQFIFYDVDDTARTDGVAVAMAPCADGDFDSRPTSLLAAGEYLTRVAALDGSGAQIAAFDSEFSLVVGSVDHYVLMDAPFEVTAPANEMTVNMSWGPGDVDCVTAGAASIFWALNDAGTGTEILSDPAGTCAGIADQLIFSDLTPGTYELFVDAESTDRLTKWQGTCDMLIHDGGTTEYNCFYDIMP